MAMKLYLLEVPGKFMHTRRKRRQTLRQLIAQNARVQITTQKFENAVHDRKLLHYKTAALATVLRKSVQLTWAHEVSLVNDFLAADKRELC